VRCSSQVYTRLGYSGYRHMRIASTSYSQMPWGRSTPCRASCRRFAARRTQRGETGWRECCHTAAHAFECMHVCMYVLCMYVCMTTRTDTKTSKVERAGACRLQAAHLLRSIELDLNSQRLVRPVVRRHAREIKSLPRDMLCVSQAVAMVS
jgi:hypothetical protein